MEASPLGISFGSINTGLPKDIVQQLMEAERIPIKKMEGRKEKIVSKKNLLAELINLATKIRDDLSKTSGSKNFRELKVNTNDSLVSVELDKGKVKPGNYNLEVLELAQKSSGMSSGFPDKNESFVGVGYIQYTLPNGESKEVYIDSDHSTLEGIASVINRDDSHGLSATVVNDGSGSERPWRLALSVEGTGDENKVEWPYFYFIDGDYDMFIEFERKATDAKVKFNGFEIEYPSNKIDDLIPGAVIDLKRAKPGEEFSVEITEDIDAISLKIGTLIESINAVIGFIKQQNSLDQHSDTSSTLGGDLVLQTMESRIRGMVFEDVSTSQGLRRVGDLGIVFQKSGLLEMDSKKFQNLLAKDYNLVSDILVGRFDSEGNKIPGFVDNLQKSIDGVLRSPDGLLRSRNQSLQSNISQIDRRIGQKERFLEQKEKTLKDKFARLESTISRIKGQGAGLSALGQSGFNPTTQLG